MTRKFFGVDRDAREIGEFKIYGVILYPSQMRRIQGFFHWKEVTYLGEAVLWPHINEVAVEYQAEGFDEGTEN